jgi:hypothetical protein
MFCAMYVNVSTKAVGALRVAPEMLIVTININTPATAQTK